MNNLLKSILIGTATTAVGVGVGFVGGSTYKAKNYDITSNSEYQQVVDKNTQLNAELENNKLALSSALTEKEQLNKELQALQSQIVNLNQTINDKSEQIKLLELDIENKQSQLDQLNQDIADKLNQIAELQENAEANAEQILALQNDIQQLNENIQNLQDDATDKDAQIEALNQQISDKLSQIEELQQNEKENALQIATLNEEINGLTANVTQLQNEIENKAIEITSLQADLENKNAEIKTLETLVAQKEEYINSIDYKINLLAKSISTIKINVDSINDFNDNHFYSMSVLNNKIFIHNLSSLWVYNIIDSSLKCLKENVVSFSVFENNNIEYLVVTYKNDNSENETKIAKFINNELVFNDYIFNSNVYYLCTLSDSIILRGLQGTYAYVYSLNTITNSISLIGSNTGAAYFQLKVVDDVALAVCTAQGFVGSSAGLYYITPNKVQKLLTHNKVDICEEIIDNKLIISAREGIYLFNLLDKSFNSIFTYEESKVEAPLITYFDDNKYLILTSAAADGDTGAVFDASTGLTQNLSVTREFVLNTKKMTEDEDFIYFGNGSGIFTFNKSDYSIAKIENIPLKTSSNVYTTFNYKNYILIGATDNHNTNVDNNLYIYDVVNKTLNTINHNLYNSTFNYVFINDYYVFNDNLIISYKYKNSNKKIDLKVDFENYELVLNTVYIDIN